MLKKAYRLKENEVKKVLKYKKPFFSYGVNANITKTYNNSNRFAIIISGKCVKNNVNRVFFRRKFYNLVKKDLFLKNNSFFDIVFIVKKEKILDKKDLESIKLFEKDIRFLIKKIFPL
ncbi:hypothetical protein H3C61_04325 [Candidatus Gracilibacteria bacterium]|nr:hypothetical protein [Candidatus Gracilibacteria bacterium]